MKIIAIDDDKEFCDYLSLIITSKIPNVNVTIANSASEALAKIQKENYDLMISDLKMPGQNGQQLLQNISTLPPSFHPKFILILSGCLAKDSPRQHSTLKKITYLSKPFDEQVLLDFIERIKQNSSSPNPSSCSNTPIEESLLDDIAKYLKEIF